MYFINITEEAEDSRKRLQGYQKGLAEVGNTLPAENILQCIISFQSAYTTIVNQVDRFTGKKSAIFTYNDMVAIGAAQAFRDCSLKIPEDVQLIGMDDIPLAGQLTPKLSTLHVPAEEMASLGCSWLRNAIEKKEIAPIKKVVRPQLYLRETTV
jgi:LacI family transcriptional regulator